MPYSIQKSHAAFTLVELLVVVAILGILMAMLAPVLASARSRVRGFMCQSNLRQIGTSSLLYAQDYDEQFACRRIERVEFLAFDDGFLARIEPLIGHLNHVRAKFDGNTLELNWNGTPLLSKVYRLTLPTAS